MPPLRLKPPWWHRSAVCQGKDSDLFFIEQGSNAKAAKRRALNDWSGPPFSNGRDELMLSVRGDTEGVTAMAESFGV